MPCLAETLTRIPRGLVALVVAGFLLAGLALDGLPSALLLAVVLLVLMALTSAAWPALRAPHRALRLLVLAVVALALVMRLA
jgi:hypothetical protein